MEKTCKIIAENTEKAINKIRKEISLRRKEFYNQRAAILGELKESIRIKEERGLKKIADKVWDPNCTEEKVETMRKEHNKKIRVLEEKIRYKSTQLSRSFLKDCNNIIKTTCEQLGVNRRQIKRIMGNLVE